MRYGFLIRDQAINTARIPLFPNQQVLTGSLGGVRFLACSHGLGSAAPLAPIEGRARLKARVIMGARARAGPRFLRAHRDHSTQAQPQWPAPTRRHHTGPRQLPQKPAGRRAACGLVAACPCTGFSPRQPNSANTPSRRSVRGRLAGYGNHQAAPRNLARCLERVASTERQVRPDFSRGESAGRTQRAGSAGRSQRGEPLGADLRANLRKSGPQR